MTIFQKIIKGREERREFTEKFEIKNEITNILKELLKSIGDYDNAIAKEKIFEILTYFNINKDLNNEGIIDAFGDIIVYSTGTIRKLGYDPDKVLNEICKCKLDFTNCKAIESLTNISEMTIFQKIIIWAEERNLIAQEFSLKNEISFILEELLESTGKYDSISAREKISELLHYFNTDKKLNPEIITESFGNIIYYSVLVIRQLKYNPNKVLDEIYKEIDSRKGEIIDGKFVKLKDQITYKADFTKCKLEE